MGADSKSTAGPTDAPPAIRVRRLTRRRGSKTVLSQLDLTLAEGECLALTGVNGAGKTTLLKCLLDLDRPNAGEIALFGKKHTGVAARERLAYLPENFRLPYYLNGWEFLAFMCGLHGVDLDVNKTGKVLESLDLAQGELEKRARDLSRGTMQKLGLASCLMSGKRLLILDEPMSGLDPKARACLRNHLCELKRQGITCLLTTHLLEDVTTLCDKVAILHGGEICYTGSPAACCYNFNAINLEQAWLRCVADGKTGPGEREGNGKFIFRG